MSCHADCPVEGQWSVWSVWSACGFDCQRHRRRFCDDPFPENGGLFCGGNDVESEACYGGSCHLDEFGSYGYPNHPPTLPTTPPIHNNLTLLFILPLLLLFITLLVVAIVICWKKMKKRNCKADSSLNPVSNLLLKPDITKSLNDSASISNNSSNNNTTLKNNNYNLNNNYNTTSVNNTSYNESNITINNNNSSGFVPNNTNNNTNNDISPSCSIQSNNTDNTNLLSESQTTYGEGQNNKNNKNKNNNQNNINNNYKYNYAFNNNTPDNNILYNNNNNNMNESIALTTTTTNNNNTNNLYNEFSSDNYSSESKNNSLESPLYAKYSIDPLSILLANQVSANVCLESLACMTVDEFGGVLTEPSSGVGVMVPEGAVGRGEIVEFFVGVSRDDKDRPKLNDSQTLLSDVIVCGPINVKLLKPCIITLPHCALVNKNNNNNNNNITNNNKNNIIHNKTNNNKNNISNKIIVKNDTNNNNNNNDDWNIAVYNSLLNYQQNPAYRNVYQLPHDNNNNNKISVHLDKTNCHIMTSFLGQFSLVGEKCKTSKHNNSPAKSANHTHSLTSSTNHGTAMAAKRLRLAVYAPMVSPSVEIIIRTYFVADTPDAIKGVEEMERGLSGMLLGETQVMSYHGNQHNLCIRLRGLSGGWECKLQDNCQEIPFSHVWNSTQSLMHCSLTLQSIHPSPHPSPHPSIHLSPHSSTHPSITFSLQIFQKGRPEDVKTFNISHNTTEIMTSSITSHQLPSATERASCGGDDDDAYMCLCGVVKRMVCEGMDGGDEWKQLAVLMRQESHLDFFSGMHSPTEALLNLWQVRCASNKNNNNHNINNNNNNNASNKNKKNNNNNGVYNNNNNSNSGWFISTLLEYLRVLSRYDLVEMVEGVVRVA